MFSLTRSIQNVRLSRNLVVVLSAATCLLLNVPSSRAGSLLNEEGIKTLAVAVTKAAHPTGSNPGLSSFKENLKDSETYRLSTTVFYHGALTGNKYTAECLIVVRVPSDNSDPLQILSIDFVDLNSTIPPNQASINRFISDTNARLRIAAASR